MASDVAAHPPAATGESKNARKKKTKTEAAAAAVPVPTEKHTSELNANMSDVVGKTNGAEHENLYIKELQKNVRNITKKLNATAKADAVVSANPNVSIDELVASRKLNADQRAQLSNKPVLQTQLAQLESQLAQYKKVEHEFQSKIDQERELLQKSQSEEIAMLRATLKAEAELEQKKLFQEKFLTLSRFLRAAAARRQLEDDESDLTKAFEGALLLVYGGDAIAVAATEKLIDGTNDNVPSTEGVLLNVTYSQIKKAALDEAPFAAEEAWAEDVAQHQPAPPESEPRTATDPTIANAGLTELDSAVPITEDSTPAAASANPTSSGDAGAANAAGGDWEKQQSGSDDPLAESFEIVPRDPAETETPAATAPVNSVQSWADEAAEPTAADAAEAPSAKPTNGGDGFHEVVHHNRGRGRGGHGGEHRGGYRGRGGGGPRGEFRGRGGRGGGRGRGGGEHRGGEHRGGPRGGGFRGAPRGDSQ